MRIGEKIKKFRLARELSQKQLAIMSGMSEPAVRNYELGNRTPSFKQLEKLAFALKLSPYALAESCLENRHGVMQVLFSMEDDFGLHPVEVDGQVMLCIDRQNKKTAPTSPEDDLWDWCRVLSELQTGAITQEEYDEWRYAFPRGKVEREKRGRNSLKKNNS
ncbi:MAG: helix-turn-helix domain-containing protein [Oscillospiraceae bacterium]|nr:helix-turn-helix domain-containing protein [Oscillospiraceae bacterium]